MQTEAIGNRQNLEDGNQPDCIGAENEKEKRQDQRRPSVDPFVADIRPHNGVAYEFDGELDQVHETRRYKPILFEITSNADRYDQEQDSRNKPEHQHMLGHGKVDPQDGRQMDQCPVMSAV